MSQSRIPPEKRKIICVDWDDAAHTDGWRHAERIAEDTPLRCRTIGFVMSETKDKIVLAQNLSLEQPTGSEAMTIPKSLIRRRRRLRL